jgi:hypothetical protein
MLDKSHICAFMYLSILDRARYSLLDDLNRRWDHKMVLLASCGRLRRNRFKTLIYITQCPLGQVFERN